MKNSKALWIAVAFVCVNVALIALAGAASAQPVTHELKPPFKFVKTTQTSQPERGMVPPGSTVLMTETFGAAFTATTNLAGNTPLWRVTVDANDTAGYFWNKTGASAPVTFTNSAWSAARFYTATQVLTPGLSTYPAGQDTWLIYGPLDLSKYVYAHLSFEAYLDSNTGDTLQWSMTSDGSTFYGNTQSGPAGQWITTTDSFVAKPSYTAVYLAFAFNSHTDPQGLGAFIRNVRLTGEPIKYGYLPIVLNNFAEATATPTLTPTPIPTATPIPPLYGYTFDPGNTSDLAGWGGAYYNSGSTKYGQCLPGQCAIHYTTPRGNPSNSLRLYTNGLYSFIASSPNDIAPSNYDLYVDLSPWVIYPRNADCPFGCPDNDWGDWYGVIFNASSDTFGANPSQFQYNKTYYRVFFYNRDAVRPIAIRLERCDGSSDPTQNSCQKLAENTTLPTNFIGNASGFDTLHIQRLASGSIKIWLNNNNTPVLTANDATYTGASHGKYGALIFSWTRNATQNPPAGYEMQIDFDNIKLYQR
jgi:hypothetical protein